MSKIKIEIKNRFTGKILFEYEKENNTIKDTVEEAITQGADIREADLGGANLYSANLVRANLVRANLYSANLESANLYSANLESANLYSANLEPFKRDMFDVLLRAIPEVDNFKKALIEGKIDGSTYNGECACLCGTLMKSTNPDIVKRVDHIKDGGRPIERFFLGIRKGDTPETNQYAKLALEWVEEFEGYLPAKLTSPDMLEALIGVRRRACTDGFESETELLDYLHTIHTIADKAIEQASKTDIKN